MSDVPGELRDLHDLHTMCPGRIGEGSCNGYCGWMTPLVVAFTRGITAGRTAERADVVAFLTAVAGGEAATLTATTARLIELRAHLDLPPENG